MLVMALLSPWVVAGAIGALRSTSNDPRQWLPRDFDETDKHLWFEDHFGIDEMAVVSWPGCTLDDPRVEKLAGALDASPRFQRVTTGPRVLRKLTSSPSRIAFDDAVKRIRGVLVGADDWTTCVLLEIAAEGQKDRSATVELVARTAERQCGLQRSALRMGGPTVDAAAIDQESRRLLLQLAGLSALVSLLIAGMRLKDVRLALILLVGAAYSTGLSLAVLYYSGGTMNLLMTMLPPLVYVLTISSGVHLLNYYRDAVREGGLLGAERRAIAHGWLPCVLAAGTTAIGLVSLATSKIVPIQEFGVYSAVGMLVSVATLLLYLPAALQIVPAIARGRANTGGGGALPRVPIELQGNAAAYLKGIARLHVAVFFVCLVAMGFFGYGLTRIESTVKLQDRFVANSKIIQDYRWLEEHLGPLVPMEVIVSFDNDCPLAFHDRIKFVGNIEEQIDAIDQVDATMSALAFTPPPPTGGGARQTIQRAVYSRAIRESRQALVDSHFLAEDPRQQLWRISVRAKALGDLDYGLFTSTLQAGVQPLIRAASDDRIAATYTGIIPLIYKAQRQLLDDLVRSFFTAFVVIAVVMMIMLRSVGAGLVAMVPNIFPAILIFGGMGWLGIMVQIGSVMTASAALGIAVDDTVHFLTWFRRGLNDQQSRNGAIGGALSRCAGAMVLTTLICGAGLAVFGLSSFVPILHFAWLMVALLAAALVGDLVLLPAMLVGPLGAVFRPSGHDPHSPRN
jgi:hypothetical protein